MHNALYSGDETRMGSVTERSEAMSAPLSTSTRLNAPSFGLTPIPIVLIAMNRREYQSVHFQATIFSPPLA